MTLNISAIDTTTPHMHGHLANSTPKKIGVDEVVSRTEELIKSSDTRQLVEWIAEVGSYDNQELIDKVNQLVEKVPFGNPRASLE